MTTESGPGGLGGGGHHARWRTGRRAHGDDGAVLVEAALVLPILLLMIFGMIEFGINLNDYQATRQGVREGARDAVVADYGSDSSCALTGVSATTTAQVNAKKIICKVKALTTPETRVRVVFTPPTGTPSTTNRGRVTVCAAKTASSVTGLLTPYLDGVHLKARAEMRAEKDLNDSTGAQAANQLTSLSETAPSGMNWSWC